MRWPPIRRTIRHQMFLAIKIQEIRHAALVLHKDAKLQA
jgi:hypothetical protein